MATISAVMAPMDAEAFRIHPERRARRFQRRRANPDGYNFIPRYVLPRLKELGASDGDIRQITVENPRRFFAGE